MTKWNPRTKRAELEAYEVDAYAAGMSLEAEQPHTRIVRREVWLDELGRPYRLVEEVIDTDE